MCKIRDMRHSNEFKERVRRLQYTKKLVEITKPPTPGFNKLGSAAQAAARSRAKAFYPFD